MPKRFYNVERTTWGLHMGRRKKVRYPRDDSEAPVFWALQRQLTHKPNGTRATYRQLRKNGAIVDLVYQRVPNGYALVERIYCSPDGKEVRREQVPLPMPASQRRKQKQV